MQTVYCVLLDYSNCSAKSYTGRREIRTRADVDAHHIAIQVSNPLEFTPDAT